MKNIFLLLFVAVLFGCGPKLPSLVYHSEETHGASIDDVVIIVTDPNDMPEDAPIQTTIGRYNIYFPERPGFIISKNPLGTQRKFVLMPGNYSFNIICYFPEIDAYTPFTRIPIDVKKGERWRVTCDFKSIPEKIESDDYVWVPGEVVVERLSKEEWQKIKHKYVFENNEKQKNN